MGRKNITGLYRPKGSEIWHIDKQIKGYGRLCESTGTSDRKEAEQYLIHRLEEIRRATVFGVRPDRLFREAATKYLLENQRKASLVTDAYHLADLDKYVGGMPLSKIHDGTLAAFVRDRKAAGIKDKSVNNALQVVRRILNLAARSWRDECGLTWLETAPLVTMLSVEDARAPYPLSWDEQRILLQALPDHLARMTLFKANTGTREQEVCQLKWAWEIPVPKLNTSVFLIPAEKVKNREERLVVLNRVAKSIVEECRGNHPIYVFTWKKGPKGKNRPTSSMNNSAWSHGRETAAEAYEKEFGYAAPEGFRHIRVHDLKHTFGRRLRAAGVPLETRKVLLGHTNGDITSHYSAPELLELLNAANQVCVDKSRKSPELVILKRQGG
jgi:integrase